MDAFSSKQLGERLRSARETAGMSTRIVARRLSLLGIPVSHATVANYEKGSTFPSTPTLQAFASIYGRPVEWFLTMGATLTGVKYRCLKSVRVAEKQAFEGLASAWAQIYLELENILGENLEVATSQVNADDTGATVARKVRDDLKLGDNPVPSVVEVLERYGIRVMQIRSEARIDGFAAWFGGTRVVVLNEALPNDRFRFNAGHELGHHLFHDCIDNADVEDAELDPRAHDFASQLLMTDEVLAEAFSTKSMVRLVQFKERYGISLAAMIYRARQSGIIPKDLYERLWRDFSRLGWRTQEPGYVRPDRPARLERLIESAVTRGKMSYGDVARIGGLNEATVRAVVLRAMGGETSLGS
jgi:Zn-dependent peptidase ImmA (M78 family)